ncbi:MAG: hypothetical protein JWO73_4 [Candidatus Taylorbacteria bacterium]|nr:hypothetical protein [Candidatus Taylorbacteria bacterium]
MRLPEYLGWVQDVGNCTSSSKGRTSDALPVADLGAVVAGNRKEAAVAVVVTDAEIHKKVAARHRWEGVVIRMMVVVRHMLASVIEMVQKVEKVVVKSPVAADLNRRVVAAIEMVRKVANQGVNQVEKSPAAAYLRRMEGEACCESGKASMRVSGLLQVLVQVLAMELALGMRILASAADQDSGRLSGICSRISGRSFSLQQHTIKFCLWLGNGGKIGKYGKK